MDPIEPLAPAPRLAHQEFQELKRLFKSVAGLRFDDSALPVFERRLATRLPLHDLTTFRDYVRLLEFGAQGSQEIAAALELVTAGETYFFRHKEQLELLEGTVFPAVAEANAASRRITIWSAGCSSGEEVYTTAILLEESSLFRGWHARVLGSDLSRERIEHARQGCYFQGAFRSTEAHIRRKYFTDSGKFWQVNAEIRRLCHFSELNLIGSELDLVVGRVDVILCRNVLIYLDQAAREQVLRSLYERLVPGGFLLLGHSESLKFLKTPLDLVSLEHDLAFRKPGRWMRRGDGG